MVTIRTCPTLLEAQFLQSVLEGEGIAAVIPQENTPPPLAGFPGGYALRVAEGDRERAIAVLGSAEASREEETSPAPGRPAGVETTAPGIRRWQAWFRWAVFVQAGITIYYLLAGEWSDVPHPAHVREYLESFVPSLELWGVGYSAYQGATICMLLGSALMLFFVSAGRWLFAMGLIGQTVAQLAFPAVIAHGWESVFGIIDFVLCGAILGMAFTSPGWERAGRAPGPR